MKSWHPITCEVCGNASASRIRKIIGTPYPPGLCRECGGLMRYGTSMELIEWMAGAKKRKYRLLGTPAIGGSWGTSKKTSPEPIDTGRL